MAYPAADNTAAKTMTAIDLRELATHAHRDTRAMSKLQYRSLSSFSRGRVVVGGRIRHGARGGWRVNGGECAGGVVMVRDW